MKIIFIILVFVSLRSEAQYHSKAVADKEVWHHTNQFKKVPALVRYKRFDATTKQFITWEKAGLVQCEWKHNHESENDSRVQLEVFFDENGKKYPDSVGVYLSADTVTIKLPKYKK